MYELPKDFDLAPFVGAEVSTIMVGLYQMDISFQPPVDPLEPYGHISIEGAWELTQLGQVIDLSNDRTIEGNERRESYRVHRLLGKAVTGWSPEPPWAFRLDFADGYSLRINDDTLGKYEYVHIQPPGSHGTEWHL